MNKKTLYTLCFVAVALMAAGSVNAATAITATSVTIGGGAFTPSNQVRVSVDTTTSTYAAYSDHLNGNRTFFTNNSDPKIYYGTRAAGTHATENASASETAPSGFSSL